MCKFHKMATKLPSRLLTTWLIISTCTLIILYSKLIPYPKPSPSPPQPHCNLFAGKWVFDPDHRPPIYNQTCPFHRNAWNCLRNERDNMEVINSWKWVPQDCKLNEIDPVEFMGVMRGKRIGFVGDSLNENFVVSLLCILRVVDTGAKKWKRKGAWRGAYFPKYDVTVAYHRAVLLAKYEWQSEGDEAKGVYRVDVDIPAEEWADIAGFYDVVVFNTGHWHFHGGDWNQNGSCLFDKPLENSELDLWFDPNNNGVNKEARVMNELIVKALQDSDIELLDLTHLSEFRADAHPATWLGKKDAVAVWGQDCMHWCLPGVPDTWVNILWQLVRYRLGSAGS